MVFDADEEFRLADGRLVGVLDVMRGMSIVMADGTVGTVLGYPERRRELPDPPRREPDGLWTSRVIGRVRHTAWEVLEFRWAGQVAKVTAGHRIWSADRTCWLRAYELEPGERVRVGNGVAEVEGPPRTLNEKLEVFGIEVEYFHNYFVGEGEGAMLVHNGPECIVRPLLEHAPQAQRPSPATINRIIQLLAQIEALPGGIGKGISDVVAQLCRQDCAFLDNPSGLANILANQVLPELNNGNMRGTWNQLVFAGTRTAIGHRVTVERSQDLPGHAADVLDQKTREAFQMKTVTGGASSLTTNLEDALQQLTGSRGELPPTNYDGIAYLILSPSNQANADQVSLQSKADYVQLLQQNNFDRTLLNIKNVRSVTIWIKSATQTFKLTSADFDRYWDNGGGS